VASFLSTLAPILGSFIMSLYALLASRDLRDASRQSRFEQLPTPFQMSLLIGSLVASLEQLRAYYSYLLSRKRRTRIPAVVHRAALMLTSSIIMASGVFVADTVLHYSTQTVDFEQITVPSTLSGQFGRGISETCLTFNRTALYGWPCSVEIGWTDPNYFFEQNEDDRLLHNTSTLSEIRVADVEQVSSAGVAYLLPQPQTLSAGSDFRATTIGVSTHCQFVSPASCGMDVWGPIEIYTNFSCTDMFHGTLGKTPNISEADGYRAPDPYRSYLMYKPASNLMYSFFSDPHMQTIYNTAGYNDTGQLDPNIMPIPDSGLVNPFYMGLAGRIASGGFQADSEMLVSNDTFHGSGDSYVDFLVNCAVSSYNVSYDWVEETMQNMSVIPTGNGSVLEIYHGSLSYTSVSGDDFTVQDFMIQAALAGTTTASFLRAFGDLYSTKVLAKIGAYTTPRMALQQQERQQMLLTKVPKAALGGLIGSSLIYTVLGLVLLYRAHKAARGKVRDIAAQLSLAGLSVAAFGDRTAGPSQSGGTSRDDLEQLSRKETRRVVVDGTAKSGFEFQVWV